MSDTFVAGCHPRDLRCVDRESGELVAVRSVGSIFFIILFCDFEHFENINKIKINV